MDSPRGDEASVQSVDVPVVTRGCSVAPPPTRTFLETTTRPRFAWHTDAVSVAVRGAATTVTGSGATRFDDVRTAGQRILDSTAVPDDVPEFARPRFFGGFAFHEGNGDADPWRGFEDAAFLLPAVQLAGANGEWWLTVNATGPDAADRADAQLARWRDRLDGMDESTTSEPPGVVGRSRTPSRAGWRDQVSAALEDVSAGALEKVVLSQALALELGDELSVAHLVDRLGDTYPDCYRFAFSPPDGSTFFGATPERLVSLEGRTVGTEALAGSTGRGDTPAEDEWLVADLLDSAKDRHEHALVVETVCDQFDSLADSVRTGERTVRQLATVQHLRTPISAELRSDEHVLSLVEALHPTPAVGGLPPDAARRTIRETEAFDRGWYAAPVGWFDAEGDGTFAVAIRSALAQNRTATLFAGAGIVADSDPDREWDEVQLKYRPILDELE